MFTGMFTSSVTSRAVRRPMPICSPLSAPCTLPSLSVSSWKSFLNATAPTRSDRSGQVHDGRTRGVCLHRVDPVQRPRPRGVALADGDGLPVSRLQPEAVLPARSLYSSNLPAMCPPILGLTGTVSTSTDSLAQFASTPRRPQPCCPRHQVGSPLSCYIYGENYKRWRRRMLL